MAAFRPIQIRGEAAALGSVSFEIAAILTARGLVDESAGQLWLSAGDLDDRLAAIREALHQAGQIGPPRGEPMPVVLTPGGSEIARIDRSAVRALGLWMDKVHINGILRGAGETRVWLARRAPDAEWNPDRFDTMVAGGRPAGHSIAQTAAAEAWEEAGLGADHLRGLRPAGKLALTYLSEKGLHREMLTMFDLDLDADFIPTCQDGEIASFHPVDLAALEGLTQGGGEMKFTSLMVCRALLGRIGRQPGGQTPRQGSAPRGR